MANWYRWEGADFVITVQVQPRARQNELVGIHGAALKIRLTAPPVAGKANAQLIKFLADLFVLPVNRINLISGATARKKILRIGTPAVIPAAIRALIHSEEPSS